MKWARPSVQVLATSIVASFLISCFGYASAAPNFTEEYRTTQKPPAVQILLGPTEELVLAADAPHCDDVDENGNRMDVPDAPLRATRWQGNILAMAAHYNNLVYSSDALQTLRRRDCNSVLKSEKNPKPAHFADREWLVSPYASNNRLFGLVHNEYWGALHNGDCKRRLGHRPPWASVCLYGNLTGIVSNDTQSFLRTGVVAAYPYPFSTDMTRNGVRDPSNLFRSPLDGYVYFMAWVDPYKDQQGGMCLFRSRDPFSSPWLAWDGTGFNAAMTSPYERKTATAPNFCKPVSGLWITTVVYYEPAKSFIAVAFDERIAPGGIFYRTSKDLIHWSRAELLMEGHDFSFWKKKGASAPVVYPSLLDPESPSLNFDTTGSKPWLYFQRVRTRNGEALGRERDIIRIRLTIAPIASGFHGNQSAN